MYSCAVCNEPAQQACEECYVSFYCSDLCQVEHECDHDSDLDDNICDVCDESIAHDVDFCGFECEAYANQRPDHDDWNHCDSCGAPADMVCERCNHAVYCGVACQERDWNYHYTHECYTPDEMSDDHIMEHMEPEFVGSPAEARLEFIEARKRVFKTKTGKRRRITRANKGKRQAKAQRRKFKRKRKFQSKKNDVKRKYKEGKFKRQIRKADRKDTAPARKAERKKNWDKFKGGVKKGAGKLGIGKKKDKDASLGDAKGSGSKKKGGVLKGAAKGAIVGGAGGALATGGNPAGIIAGAGGGAAVGVARQKRKQRRGV